MIDYITHYNAHRPHRSLEQRPPRHTTPDDNTTDHPLPCRLVRTTRCDGLINEYKTRRLTRPDRVSGTHRPGVAARILQRLLALTAAIWHNQTTQQPGPARSLIAYDH